MEALPPLREAESESFPLVSIATDVGVLQFVPLELKGPPLPFCKKAQKQEKGGSHTEGGGVSQPPSKT
jgi:hypothetical protein